MRDERLKRGACTVGERLECVEELGGERVAYKEGRARLCSVWRRRREKRERLREAAGGRERDTRGEEQIVLTITHLPCMGGAKTSVCTQDPAAVRIHYSPVSPLRNLRF